MKSKNEKDGLLKENEEVDISKIPGEYSGIVNFFTEQSSCIAQADVLCFA